MTPPDFGQFRLAAERAIVVDFKAWVQYDTGMLAWHQRMVNTYGKPEAIGFAGVREMDKAYRTIGDDQIRDLQRVYGISYAVLYRETETDFPILFENDTYRLIQVD